MSPGFNVLRRCCTCGRITSIVRLPPIPSLHEKPAPTHERRGFGTDDARRLPGQSGSKENLAPASAASYMRPPLMIEKGATPFL